MAGQLSVPRSTVTDDEGRFVFTALAAGSLSLSVSKPGFVSSYYGSKTPGRPPGVPIALPEGQRLTNVSVRLLPGSVITGRVTRERGQPAVGVSVQAAFVQMVNGQRRQSFIASAQALSAQTDDRGEYRLYGLAPGEYLITARAGLGFGTAGDARQMTAAELRWAEQTTGRGGAASPAASVPPAPGQTMIYSTVYFPGTADASAAATVTIGPGEERSGVSFTTPLVPTARITGTIVDPSGAPIPGAQVQLRSKRAAEGLSDIIDSLLTTSATSAADGSFTLSSITPGEYRLSVRAAEPRPGAAGQRVAAAAGVVRRRRPSEPLGRGRRLRAGARHCESGLAASTRHDRERQGGLREHDEAGAHGLLAHEPDAVVPGQRRRHGGDGRGDARAVDSHDRR
jgi:protocatechuate 3,4-dioxygenase beta subunit